MNVSVSLLVAVCWAGALSDVLVAAAVMLLVGRHIATTGALVGAHGAPLRKLALGLGAGCGLAGCFVIHRLHGDSRRYALIHVRHSPDSLDKCMISAWGAISLHHSAESLKKSDLFGWHAACERVCWKPYGTSSGSCTVATERSGAVDGCWDGRRGWRCIY